MHLLLLLVMLEDFDQKSIHLCSVAVCCVVLRVALHGIIECHDPARVSVHRGES